MPPRASTIARALPAPRAVVQLLPVDARWPLDSLDGFIVCELLPAPPRTSLSPDLYSHSLLSSSSSWSMLGDLDSLDGTII